MHYRPETMLAVLQAVGSESVTVGEFSRVFWAVTPARPVYAHEKPRPSAPRRRLGPAGRLLASLVEQGFATRWGGRRSARARFALTAAGREELARLRAIAQGE